MNHVTGLFDRLPAELFGPLASKKNHSRFWDLLLRLHDQFFGPEAAPPEGDGYTHRSLTLEIERYILEVSDWALEDNEAPDTPLSVLSNIIYRRLTSSGWLREDRIGVRNFVSMPPTVQKFLELLRQFAEEGPQIIGGKVQLIHNQLEQVLADPARQASGFHEAARQARQLIASLSATTMRARDAMELLARQETTANYIRAFFDQYIGQLYIRDYHELRTENHPLRNRGRIIEVAQALRDSPEKRRAMIDYYQSAFRCADRDEAAIRFEKDVSRFLLFNDIDAHLDRLNASVERATAQAIATLNYKLRTQDKLDQLLRVAVRHVIAADDSVGVKMGALPGPLLGESRFPVIPRRSAPVVRTGIKKKVMSVEQRAHVALKRAMRQHREVTPDHVIQYLERHLERRQSLSSDALLIGDIHDFCVFVTVTRMALLSRNHAGAGKKFHPLLVALKNYRFECIAGEWTDNPYIRVPRYQVERKTSGVTYAA